MPRRLLAVVAAVALLLQLSLPLFGQDQPAKPRVPNIVLLVADDLGYGELGCQGNRQIPTPNIDAIAASGVRFTDGYVTAPFCAASRAGFLTGRYQTRFGFEFNPIGAVNEDPDAGLPVGERTLANVLHDAGYATGLIGKWHLGGTAKYHPHRRGFDDFFGFLHEGHYFVPPPFDGVTTMLRRKTLPGGRLGRWASRSGKLVLSTHMKHDEPAYDADNPIYRGGQPVVETEYLTDALTREATGFIQQNSERPFFLYLAYNAVHSPLQGADRYMERFVHIEDIQRRIFAAMLSNLDDSVGAVVNSLKAAEVLDNTLIVFFSDNGGPTRELTSSNAPLRGEKGQVYEGGLRVPFLMQWPGRIPAGTEFIHPIISLDVFATATVAANATTDRKRLIDGVNLLPHLTAEKTAPPHEDLYWRIGGRQAVRAGDWKLLRNSQGRDSSVEWELYNLRDDISESRNVASEHPERVSQLTKNWERYNAQMVEPLEVFR